MTLKLLTAHIFWAYQWLWMDVLDILRGHKQRLQKVTVPEHITPPQNHRLLFFTLWFVRDPGWLFPPGLVFQAACCSFIFTSGYESGISLPPLPLCKKIDKQISLNVELFLLNIHCTDDQPFGINIAFLCCHFWAKFNIFTWLWFNVKLAKLSLFFFHPSYSVLLCSVMYSRAMLIARQLLFKL